MKEPYLKDYSLVLIKDCKVIFKSKKDGLNPLIECINKFKSKEKNCTLYDRVIGLAAAKLIVYSGFIKEVATLTCSKPAFGLLKKEKIELKADKIVENILRKDKKGICPMEIKALNTDKKIFITEMNKMLKTKPL